jgi:preprotein translocase subunit SecE
LVEHRSPKPGAVGSSPPTPASRQVKAQINERANIVTMEETKPKTSLTDFVRETQQEIKKVTWPTRKETITTTIMIVVMALITGMFFLAVDTLLGYLISHLLGMQS